MTVLGTIQAVSSPMTVAMVASLGIAVVMAATEK